MPSFGVMPSTINTMVPPTTSTSSQRPLS
jgi:hypothetical protein